MNLMIDTNVVLDIMIKRKPFYDMSFQAAMNMEENADHCMLSTSAATDIYYISKKYLGDSEAREALVKIRDMFYIVETIPEDLEIALISPVNDLEDALVSAIADRKDADYIITRNTKDFEKSKVPAITPEEFVDLIGLST